MLDTFSTVHNAFLAIARLTQLMRVHRSRLRTVFPRNRLIAFWTSYMHGSGRRTGYSGR